MRQGKARSQGASDLTVGGNRPDNSGRGKPRGSQHTVDPVLQKEALATVRGANLRVEDRTGPAPSLPGTSSLPLDGGKCPSPREESAGKMP